MLRSGMGVQAAFGVMAKNGKFPDRRCKIVRVMTCYELACCLVRKYCAVDHGVSLAISKDQLRLAELETSPDHTAANVAELDMFSR